MVTFVLMSKSKSTNTALGDARRVYIERSARYTPTREVILRDEAMLLDWASRQSASMLPWLVLLDSQGKSFTSNGLALEWRRWRDAGRRHIAVAIGPPDGWSAEVQQRADFLLSLGPMTLPHELAAVVAAEQVYRALTILAGHPYHCSH